MVETIERMAPKGRKEGKRTSTDKMGRSDEESSWQHLDEKGSRQRCMAVLRSAALEGQTLVLKPQIHTEIQRCIPPLMAATAVPSFITVETRLSIDLPGHKRF